MRKNRDRARLIVDQTKLYGNRFSKIVVIVLKPQVFGPITRSRVTFYLTVFERKRFEFFDEI